MSIWDHIEELRARLMRCLALFMFGFVGCYFVSDHIMGFLRQPLFDALPPDQQKLYFTHLFENFMTHLKISAVASVFIFSPFIFYQLWAFIAPGLYPKERRLVVPFISAATFFFLGGAAFAYYGLFPVGFKFFVTYGSPSDVPLLTIDSYYSMVLKLLLLFGLAFELPVFVVLLGYLGVVDAPLLRTQRKTAIIIITVLSAMFAPPDALSMIMLGAPLCLLYEGAILVVARMRTRVPPSDHPDDQEPQDPLTGKSR